ncbi:MAG: EamA family transporter [bacterium]|nr:EamA family transporter [bacterium]
MAALAVVILWASGFVALKAALEEISPTRLALARYSVAAIVFGALSIVRRVRIPRGYDMLRTMLAGAIGISLYNLLLNFGQQTVTAGIASILVNTVPILTSLFSMALLGERISRAGWSGTLLSFTGVAIIGLQKSGWTGFETGTLCVLGAAVSQAVYIVMVKPMLKRHHPIDLTSVATWFGCLFLIPFGSGLGEALPDASFRTLGAIVFLGIGPAALAYVAWSYVLVRTPAGKASNVLFLVPLVACGLGWWVLGEVPSPVALGGGALALLGVLVTRGVFRRRVQR